MSFRPTIAISLPVCWAHPHPGSVLFHFLEQLAQFILNIINPQHAADLPPYLNQTQFYTKAFWHVHLNYACTQFSDAHRGPERLLGNQLIHWISDKADACMKITHLCIYIPPVLGAYLLHHHSSQPPTLSIPTPDQAAQGEGTFVHISQSAHFAMPTVIEQQADRLTCARQAAARGALSSYTIPLLGDTQTLHSRCKIHWSLKCILSASTTSGSTLLCQFRWDRAEIKGACPGPFALQSAETTATGKSNCGNKNVHHPMPNQRSN